jgi:phosphoribosylaminoimidazolecarboxamide formyltransferase/IMP cyclohydrolase
VKIRRALLSVSDKRGLTRLASGLVELDVEIVSTSGTAEFLRNAGVAVTTVEEVTGSAEILGGRVKTLHPAVFAGILARRNRDEDMASLGRASVRPIDLVVCNLYPFRAVSARRCSIPSRAAGGGSSSRASPRTCIGSSR